MSEAEQRRDVDDVAERISRRLGKSIPHATITDLVRQQFGSFEQVAVRQFVPVFVERRVRAELGSR